MKKMGRFSFFNDPSAGSPTDTLALSIRTEADYILEGVLAPLPQSLSL
jgi:hypothetical protein